MYAPELISAVSSLSQPSDNLLHHCYAHLYLKVWTETYFPAFQRQMCVFDVLHIYEAFLEWSDLSVVHRD